MNSVMSQIIYYAPYPKPGKNRLPEVLLVLFILGNLLILPPTALMFFHKFSPNAHAKLVKAVPILKIYSSIYPEAKNTKRPNK